MLRYALTILLSAFLLFQVQPLIARYILPWFGGSPAVWTTCQLFFQMLLLLGYLYAHLLSTKLQPKAQTVLHMSLLGLSLLMLPIIPHVSWKPAGDENPALRILLLLTVTVGAPYLLLSTTGPLVQRWFSLAKPGVSPYRLFALSNFGSLAALLTYPFLFEPLLNLSSQAFYWSVSYGVFTLLCISCAWQLFRHGPGETLESALGITAEPAGSPDSKEEQTHKHAGGKQILLWVLLAVFPSMLFLATTNQLCQEVAVIPFLWVLPLSLYLLSFIIAFDSSRWYKREYWFPVMMLSVLAVSWCIYKGVRIGFLWQILAYCSALFSCAMCCHGELSFSRPPVKSLTLYYLCIAAGGAIGGVFVVFLAPLIFSRYWELQLGLVGCVLLAFVAYRRSIGEKASGVFWAMLSTGVLVFVLSSIFETKAWQKRAEDGETIAQMRNFYGVMAVKSEVKKKIGEVYSLIHGTIQHGIQIRDPQYQLAITSYYAPESGVGTAFTYHPKRLSDDPLERDLRVGIVGLGTGSLAAWGEEGDVFRFYELNHQVKDVAEEYFTYLEKSPAKVEVILGDARMKMEQELAEAGSQQYDILIIDAFSSDAIPMHLLTRECMKLYWTHLKPDGILAVHASNRFLNLRPVVKSLAEEQGYTAIYYAWLNMNNDPALNRSEWILVTDNKEFLSNRKAVEQGIPWPKTPLPKIIWTDNYSSLWSILSH